MTDYTGMDGDWMQWDTRLASQKARDRKVAKAFMRERAITAMAHTDACDDPTDLMIETESAASQIEADIDNGLWQKPSVAHCPSEAESLDRCNPGKAWVQAKVTPQGAVTK